MTRRPSRTVASPKPSGMTLQPPTMGRDGSTDSFVSGLVSDDGSAMSDSFSKREKIVKEIVETERRFLADMYTLREIYVIPATEEGHLSASDCKILFSNLDGVIQISTLFLEELEIVTAAEPFMIGAAFLKHLQGIEDAYADYCRNNEGAIIKIGELLSPDSPQSVRDFLKQCQIQLQGKTGAWDLSSLVIKPVQRVLKYPLLVKQLLKETPSSNPDYQNLLKCSTDVEKVAENINEYKKRKDTVEKYVEGKNKINVMHGITKKITRGVQELKQATGTGGEITVDAEYDEMVRIFEELHKKITALLRDELRYWLRSVKEFLERQLGLAIALEEVYEVESNDIRGAGYKFVAVEYRKACEWLVGNPVKQAENEVTNTVIPVLQRIEKIFKDLSLVIKKRAKKKLDFERKRAMEAKGDAKPDRALELSADEYRALHAELLDELPKFLTFALQYFDAVLKTIVEIQTQVHMEVRNRLDPVAENFLSTRSAVSPLTGKRRSIVVGMRSSTRWPEGEVIGRWREGFEGEGSGELRSIVENMTVLEQWKADVLENPNWQPAETPRRPKKMEKTLSPKQPRKASGVSEISSAFRFPKSGSSSPKTSPSSRRVSIQIVSAQPMGSTHAPSSPTSTTSSFEAWRQDSTTSITTSPQHASEAEEEEEEEVGRRVGFEVEACYAFAREMEDELEFEVGDRIWVDLCGGRGGDPTEDWWHGYRVDDSFEGGYSGDGWFPASYVEAVDS
ncbi:hypothetical protein HDU67_003017 [Dinochytrium kinnereticum]|nr:hypothetical protein HDU67_003017 [Dinochytrium kinnereticum]